MKQISILLILLVCGMGWGYAQSGIRFEKNMAWKEIKAKAASQDRLIFVDAYTTWCGPCKKMAREVFPQKEVANFYNKHFINVQIDMEKGEGPSIARDYNVYVYPTLLFLDGKGNLVHRAAGYQAAAEFVALGTTAIDPTRRLSSMHDRFAQGDRDPEFLLSYTEVLAGAYDGSHAPIAEAYMNTQTNWNTEVNRAFVFRYINNTESKLFDHLVDNRKDYIGQFGQRAVADKMQKLIISSIDNSKEQSSLEQIDALFKKAYPEKAKQMSASFRLTYYRQAGDRENFAKAAIRYYKKFPSKDPGELNDIAWTFYTVIDNRKQLRKAVKWAKKSIRYDSNFYNHDTLAALYYKLGKKKKAIKAAKKAIAIAQEKGEDYSATQELLDEIYKL